jgi:hypothetical protein
LVIEVEVLEALAGREAGGADAVLAAVVLAGRDLPFETGGEELLVRPAIGACSLGKPVDGGGQRRRLERPSQIGDVALRLRGCTCRHHATPVARS